VRTPDDGLPTQAELQDQVDKLAHQCSVDLETIEHLEHEVAADRVKITNLEIALHTARRIGAAIGILMALRRISDDEAFALLRRASQNQHRKLRAVAEDVIRTGTLGD
jgi:AmiR/NasT family two-component response regulator